MKTQSNLKRLLTSRTRLKLIEHLFYFPQNFYYVRQLVRLTQEEINSVRRELANLKASGIVSSESRTNKLYYWANSESPFFPDLLQLANKISGLGAALNHQDQLKLLFYNRQFALGQPPGSDTIDLIIVGDLPLRSVEGPIKEEERLRGREINYMLMSRSEFQLRRQKRDPFIIDFFLAYPLLVLGNPKEILHS
ncbi:hypothetical protein A3K55_00605 [Candidatus Shapirobacteria bacterium RBG_13_44_7]|uniref:HTH arsR-type domain-containing protein n=1 Tax=Candidatus Shapirobacteria bacterium RBG_13_44_7 TaxID=1802149 RepID=A0A1F7SEV7_9BACT|nr:MAG: hypothetical protein A3K55_00605 [Candidatus Shapirobacteria bacterium RBG_13_44_7]